MHELATVLESVGLGLRRDEASVAVSVGALARARADALRDAAAIARAAEKDFGPMPAAAARSIAAQIEALIR